MTEPDAGSDAFSLEDHGKPTRRPLRAERGEDLHHQRAPRPTCSSCSPPPTARAPVRRPLRLPRRPGTPGLTTAPADPQDGPPDLADERGRLRRHGGAHIRACSDRRAGGWPFSTRPSSGSARPTCLAPWGRWSDRSSAASLMRRTEAVREAHRPVPGGRQPHRGHEGAARDGASAPLPPRLALLEQGGARARFGAMVKLRTSASRSCSRASMRSRSTAGTGT